MYATQKARQERLAELTRALRAINQTPTKDDELLQEQERLKSRLLALAHEIMDMDEQLSDERSRKEEEAEQKRRAWEAGKVERSRCWYEGRIRKLAKEGRTEEAAKMLRDCQTRGIL